MAKTSTTLKHALMPSKKLTFTDASKFVTLYATHEPEAKPMKVHKDFACHYSPVFKAAFESQFIEGTTQEYRFEDCKEDVLHNLIAWIYTQDLELQERSEDVIDECIREDVMLVELWILADKLLIPRLQNLVIQKIDDIGEKAGATLLEGLHFLWSNTTKDSPLRMYFVAHLSNIEAETFVDSIDRFPKEMLSEVIRFLSKLCGAQEIDVSDYMIPE